MKKISHAFLLFSLFMLTSCFQTAQNHTRGVYMLLDTSGTYAEEIQKAQSIINYLLGTLQPGDTMVVARIDSGSFSEKDIVAKATFDSRPSVANKQKRVFLQTIQDFASTVKGSKYTDISGGLLQGVEFLNEKGVGKKVILIYSDLQEELPKGHVRDFPMELSGFVVVALNVTKLRGDIKDPKQYLDRIEYWRDKVESNRGEWKVINDLDRLESIFE
ncbi:MAG: VWA domain-containing protein [Nitrospinota bacterium]|nr:VWA domain-containing protein [Nitrospinota bacterium]